MTTRQSTPTILVVLLLIITFPFWVAMAGVAIGLVAAAFGIVMGVLGAVFGALFGVFTLPFKIFSWDFPFHHFSMSTWIILILVVALVWRGRK